MVVKKMAKRTSCEVKEIMLMMMGVSLEKRKKYVQKLSSAFCEGDDVDDGGGIFREKKRKYYL